MASFVVWTSRYAVHYTQCTMYMGRWLNKSKQNTTHHSSDTGKREKGYTVNERNFKMKKEKKNRWKHKREEMKNEKWTMNFKYLNILFFFCNGYEKHTSMKGKYDKQKLWIIMLDNKFMASHLLRTHKFTDPYFSKLNFKNFSASMRLLRSSLSQNKQLTCIF